MDPPLSPEARLNLGPLDPSKKNRVVGTSGVERVLGETEPPSPRRDETSSPTPHLS